MAITVNVLADNHVIVHDDSPQLKTARVWIKTAASREARGRRSVVSFSVTFAAGRVYGRRQTRPVTVDLYRDRGQRPELVMQAVEENGSLPQALRYLVGQRREVDELGEIVSVEMTLTPPRPDTRQRAA